MGKLAQNLRFIFSAFAACPVSALTRWSTAHRIHAVLAAMLHTILVVLGTGVNAVIALLVCPADVHGAAHCPHFTKPAKMLYCECVRALAGLGLFLHRSKTSRLTRGS
jgi:hypothetical protein